MKYRKKPVVIDAVQLLWQNWNEICDFVSKEAFGGGTYLDEEGKPTEDSNGRLGLKIKTLEGEMIGTEGDYIIKGIKGEFYACKPDIFTATYELLDGQNIVSSTSNQQEPISGLL